MQRLTDEEYSAMVRWAEERPETNEMDPIEVQLRWRRATGRLREQPPRARRYRLPQGVRVDAGPLMDEKEWDWHE